jgi:protein-tyrosine-phosphatase
MLRHRAGNRVRVSSAGTAPKDRIHPHVVRVLREQYGIDIAGQAPRLLDLASGSAFDRVVTLCDRAREVLPGAGDWLHLHWSIPDPAQDARGNRRSDYPRFVSAARDIDTRVRFLLPTLLSPTHKEDRP